jgi:hypothetical protein
MLNFIVVIVGEQFSNQSVSLGRQPFIHFRLFMRQMLVFLMAWLIALIQYPLCSSVSAANNNL